jgi:YD repeat-containing protein
VSRCGFAVAGRPCRQGVLSTPISDPSLPARRRASCSPAGFSLRSFHRRQRDRRRVLLRRCQPPDQGARRHHPGGRVTGTTDANGTVVSFGYGRATRRTSATDGTTAQTGRRSTPWPEDGATGIRVPRFGKDQFENAHSLRLVR